VLAHPITPPVHCLETASAVAALILIYLRLRHRADHGFAAPQSGAHSGTPESGSGAGCAHPNFHAEAHRQSAAIAASWRDAEDQAFIDAASDWGTEMQAESLCVNRLIFSSLRTTFRRYAKHVICQKFRFHSVFRIVS
jgi:hypothetical protein